MNATEQGTRDAGGRNLATSRVLIFLTSTHPATGARELLLLKGAPAKRLWANRYNGLGGHVEATEDVYTAAVREVWEEAGIEVRELALRGVVTIDTGFDEFGRRPGVVNDEPPSSPLAPDSRSCAKAPRRGERRTAFLAPRP